jgi:hypothetical protein
VSGLPDGSVVFDVDEFLDRPLFVAAKAASLRSPRCSTRPRRERLGRLGAWHRRSGQSPAGHPQGPVGRQIHLAAIAMPVFVAALATICVRFSRRPVTTLADRSAVVEGRPAIETN